MNTNEQELNAHLEAEFEEIQVVEEVIIPTLDGTAIAERIPVTVTALKSRKTGEIYLDGNALAELDKVKARHMGLLTPLEIKDLRETVGLSQKQISTLLQIGEKSWTRWETGRERPSRSFNVLLNALADGRIDIPYLKSLMPGYAKVDFQMAPTPVKQEYTLLQFDSAYVAANEAMAKAA